MLEAEPMTATTRKLLERAANMVFKTYMGYGLRKTIYELIRI